VQASELAVTAVLSSLRACGLSGYRNDTEFTIGRLLRDVLSAPLMINNDRILAISPRVPDDAVANFNQWLKLLCLTSAVRVPPPSMLRPIRLARSQRDFFGPWASMGCTHATALYTHAVERSKRTLRGNGTPARKSCASRR